MDKTFDLGYGAEGRFIYSDRFNTTLISFHFYLPLDADTMTEDALLPYLLTSCSNDFKTFTELNTKLLKLYGAELGCSVGKSGDYLHSKISLSVINSSFAFDKEDMIQEATNLLISLIFNPLIENENFRSEDLEREKRKTIERIESEINNKRSYARTKLIGLLFKDSPYGRFVYGTPEEVKAVTTASMYSAWKRFLSKSFIQLNVVGREMPDSLFTITKDKLSEIDRSDVKTSADSEPLTPADSVTSVTDNMDVTQGKLVMGFSSELYGSLEKALPLMIFSDIFGGGPYSRLFSNVREKLSLCYYCSSVQRRSKGFLIVDSGVEAENCDAAEKAIFEELSEIQKGVVEDFRFDASKKSVIDSIASYYDSANALDMWHTKDIAGDSGLLPENIIESIRRVTKEDVISAARGIKLHSVYRLMPLKEVEK